MERYTTGTGQVLWVHEARWCTALVGPVEDWCVIHKRKPGPQASFPTNWRSGWGGFMEVICPHGVGHPAPEGFTLAGEGHGCCHEGCCGL